MKQVLFLCSSDYYRSRISEEYFNYWAERFHLPYHAISRSLLEEQKSISHWGMFAIHLQHILEYLAISSQTIEHPPQSVSYQELATSDYIYSIDGRGHPSVIDELYPEFKVKCRYFLVGEDDVEPVSQATERLMNELDLWLAKLCQQQDNDQ